MAAWGMEDFMARPRQPQKRKRETWKEYIERERAWRSVYGAPNPTGFGPESDWQNARERIAAAAANITSPGDAFCGDMIQLAPAIRCNAAGLAWLKRGMTPDPDGPRKCPYNNDGPCTHPNPDIGRSCGTVTAARLKPVFQMYLFDAPKWRLEYEPCCIEGLYRLVGNLKKQGYTVQKVFSQAADVKNEIEILFGLKPC